MINITALDEVFIEGLTIDTVIGVFDWERKITQQLVVDLQIFSCQKKASVSDDVSHAIDYKKVCEQVTSKVVAIQAQLIERVAQEVADMLLMNDAIEKITVTVRKPTAIKETQAVGVKITRLKNR